MLDAFPDVSAEILRTDGTYVARMTPYEKEHLEICQVEPILAEPGRDPRGVAQGAVCDCTGANAGFNHIFLQRKNWDCADFVQSEARFYEMLPKGATKGSALRRYRTLCGAENWKITAAGDFDNDLEMLRAADHSACPSNAQPCVKKIVDIQLTQSCETNAIAELILILRNIGGS